VSMISTSHLLRLRLLEGVVGKAGRIGAELGADEFRLGAVGPDLQLLDGSGTERIAGCNHDLETGARELRRQLADRRRLAGAVDADDEDHMRLVAEIELQRLGDRLQHLGDFVRHDAADVLAASHPCHSVRRPAYR
jgi:hypothetical protein